MSKPHANSFASGRRPGRRRLALVVGTLAMTGVVPVSDAAADGNKFEWTKNGNSAAVFWRSWIDPAYMHVKTTARQRRGKRRMYVKVDFFSLRCSGGQNTCFSIGVGGVIGYSEGAEWHQIGHNRLANLPKDRKPVEEPVSQPLDPDSSLMQARIHLCYDRNITPDPCSRPYYATHSHNNA